MWWRNVGGKLKYFALAQVTVFILYLAVSKTQVESSINSIYSISEQMNQLDATARVLCLVVPSEDESHQPQTISKTWGKQCKVLIFIARDKSVDTSDTESSYNWANGGDQGSWFTKSDETYIFMTKNVFSYIWARYAKDADWFVMTDYANYVSIENLNELLRPINTLDAVWFNWPRNKSTNNLGYLLSKETFHRLAVGFGNHSSCLVISSDVDKCLADLGSKLIETHDPSGRERFLSFHDTAEANLLDQVQCCSTPPIGFYGVKPSQMFIIELLMGSRFTGSQTVKSGNPAPDNRRILFLETSGRPELKLRAACAVESAAKENPDRPIQVAIFNSTPDASSPTIQVFKHYRNIQVYSLSFEEYFNATPFEQWFRDGKWRQSPHAVAHLSDYLRILSLWKGGGIYMDTDFVILRSLGNLANFSCSEDPGIASNGVIGLDRGHPLLDIVTANMSANYNPGSWSGNGLGILKRSLQVFCNEMNGTLMTPEKCHGYQLLPRKYFYKLHYSNLKDLFQDSDNPNNLLSAYNESYALHAWNKLTVNKTVRVGSKQMYSLAAAKHCPLVFAAAATEF